jgi:putative cell wall-binding protein
MPSLHRFVTGLWPRLAMALLLVAGAALVAPGHTAAVGGDTFVSLANQKRASVGKAAVSLSAAVDAISVERGNAMASRDVLAHDLAYVQRRLGELGQCYSAVGEIIAWERGYPSYSYSRTVDAWWASTTHHAIMVGDYNAAGGSWATSASGTTYSVMVFAKLCAPPATPTTSSTTRVSGPDRYATAAAISAASFAPGVSTAVLATGAVFPDALTGGPYAARFGGPVLLVRSDSIPAATAAELTRLRPQRIVILGGTGSVGNGVASQAATYTSGSVSRLAGADRYATAAAISAAGFAPGVSVAYVATGTTFADALSGAALAARNHAPVLLVRTDAIPASTAAELKRLQPARIVVLGGPGSVSSAVADGLDRYTNGSVTRLWGDDRYSTAAAISAAAYAANGPDTVYVSSGSVFPDGLAAGPVAGRGADPVLLVRSTSLPSEIAQELQRLNPSRVIVVGGPGTVSDGVLAAIDSVLN